MLSRNNHQEQFKKYEPKKQRFTIKKLSVGVASVLLGISFANGVSADTTDASADTNANNGDGSEQTDHNLVLNSANNQTLKEATAANQASVQLQLHKIRLEMYKPQLQMNMKLPLMLQ